MEGKKKSKIFKAQQTGREEKTQGLERQKKNSMIGPETTILSNKQIKRRSSHWTISRELWLLESTPLKLMKSSTSNRPELPSRLIF